MKMFKLALLGGAALAVTAASAQADELSDLKAQLESLQSRVAQMETQPAQTSGVPAGASLVMFKTGQAFIDNVPRKADDRIRGDEGFSIAVTPTADMPAPVAEVTVSGNIRTLLVYSDSESVIYVPSSADDPATEEDEFFEGFSDTESEDNLDVTSRSRLVVDGKTETAVGEVGGHIRLQGGDFVDGDTTAEMNEWWGYWQMNDSWQIRAGRWDNTAAVQSGLDWDVNLGATGGVTNSGVEQIRLIYTGGPITWAVAVEDPQQFGFVDADGDGEADFAIVDDKSDIIEGASYIQYNGDGVMLMASGVIADDDIGEDEDWFVGAGARFGLGDVATVSLAAGWGDGYNRNNILGLETPDTEYWGVSGLLIFHMNEATRLEIGGAYDEADNEIAAFAGESHWVATAGIYWEPVSQLTIGLQADYQQVDLVGGEDCGPDGDCATETDNFDLDDQVDAFAVRFGTWFRF